MLAVMVVVAPMFILPQSVMEVEIVAGIVLGVRHGGVRGVVGAGGRGVGAAAIVPLRITFPVVGSLI